MQAVGWLLPKGRRVRLHQVIENVSEPLTAYSARDSE